MLLKSNVSTYTGTGNDNVLRQVEVPIMSREKCRDEMYSQIDVHVSANEICAGYHEGGKDSCDGDSGGPLICRNAENRWWQHGVVSWGKGCADPDFPGVYVDVAKLLSWITEKTGSRHLYVHCVLKTFLTFSVAA